MNQRNVEAIYELLSEAHTELLAYAGEQDRVRRTAAFLAARGVLVPSALTDEQGFDVGGVNDFTAMRTVETEAKEASQVRSLLERIAKGEGQ